MNKNVIIGVLAVAVIVGGGYLLSQNKPVPKEETKTETKTDTKTPVTKTPATPPATVPPLVLGAPTVETSPNYNASISTAFVTGLVNPKGVSTIYWFEYGETASLGSRTTTQQIGSGFYNISAPALITGLRSNTSYYFRLMANNNFGTVYGATFSLKTNMNPAPKAAMPTVKTNSASDVSRTSAKLNGQVNPNGWQTNYWFEYGTTTGLGSVSSITGVADNSTSSSSVSDSLSGLAPLTKYYFRINAQNQYGTVNGSTLNFTTSGPANPSAPAVTTNNASNITKNEARLNGRINPNGAEANYWFEYSEDSLLGSILGTTSPIKTINAGNNSVSVNENISGLAKDTKYYYRLVGRNSIGTVQGSIVSFTTRD